MPRREKRPLSTSSRPTCRQGERAPSSTPHRRRHRGGERPVAARKRSAQDQIQTERARREKEKNAKTYTIVEEVVLGEEGEGEGEDAVVGGLCQVTTAREKKDGLRRDESEKGSDLESNVPARRRVAVSRSPLRASSRSALHSRRRYAFLSPFSSDVSSQFFVFSPGHRPPSPSSLEIISPLPYERAEERCTHLRAKKGV